MPYQQKPIDLFKAIFEASDSEDEADEEEVDASKKRVNSRLMTSPKRKQQASSRTRSGMPLKVHCWLCSTACRRSAYPACWPSPAT